MAFTWGISVRPWRYALETVASWILYLFSLGSSNKLLVLGSWLTFGFSDTLLLLCSQLSPGPVRQALDATLSAVYWNFQHALGVFNSLNYLASCPILSLCLVLGRASTLLTLRSWLLLKHGALFLLLFTTHWIPTRSWCYVLGSGSQSLDATVRAEPCLRTVQDAVDATVHHNRDDMICSYNFFFSSFQRTLVGATLRLLTLRSGESYALRAMLLALFWNIPGRSSCYALLFFLKHSSMRLMLRSDLQHVLDARLLGFSWSFNTLSWYYCLGFSWNF